MRAALAAAAVSVLCAVPAAASAVPPGGAQRYAGTTSQGQALSFRVDTPGHRTVKRFALRYRSTCDDGETLRSTFRFAPVKVTDADRFARTGSVHGMLTDGRAYTAVVKLSGRLGGDGAAGSFRLATRIPDAQGGVARCATGPVSWNASAGQ